MSNVKVNGNTYNEVTSVRLPLSDGTGYATFDEGGSSNQDIYDMFFTKGADLGDVESNVDFVDIRALNGHPFGTANFPAASKIRGNLGNVTFDNLLAPNAGALHTSVNDPGFALRSCIVSGTVDLRNADPAGGGYPNLNQTFYGSTIGTLLIQKFPNVNDLFLNATITNLYWNNPDITAGNMAGAQGLQSATAITNAYVPDTLYDGIKALMDAGTLTNVTNLYKISDWSDD